MSQNIAPFTGMEKYYNEKGQVAVLYSPGFGAGWSSWARSENCQPFLTMNKGLVELALKGASEAEVEEYLAQELGEDVYIYTGGWDQIEVRFLNPGTAFRITEYDGSESIEDLGSIDFLLA